MGKMLSTENITFFWFRRDLRLEDNIGFCRALAAEKNVQPIFIFDEQILNELDRNDARVTFIHRQLTSINQKLVELGSSLLVLHGDPEAIWKSIIQEESVHAIYFNEDYEPYALDRDATVENLALENGVTCKSFKDQVVFSKDDILKDDGKPYTVFTPFKNRWLEAFKKVTLGEPEKNNYANLNKSSFQLPTLNEIGFEESSISVPDYDLEVELSYSENRDFPAKDATSHLSTHLRFGTVSIRNVIRTLENINGAFMSELIWREFFMQILYHFPDVVTHNFKRKYDGIHWLNDKQKFELWCEGKTGYPIVDAGMRELNKTGYMHNRVRMVVASFLCKHLLTDWRWGEAYFAQKLLDYELASNNGNWQWAAGTGCDAAPYFRVFNPMTQQTKYDKDLTYIKRWVPELNTPEYPEPIVDHKLARERAIEAYKKGLS